MCISLWGRCTDFVGGGERRCGDPARTPLGRDGQGIRCGYSMWVCIERLSTRARESYLRENLCRTLHCVYAVNVASPRAGISDGSSPGRTHRITSRTERHASANGGTTLGLRFD